jgi:hypothetical protein
MKVTGVLALLLSLGATSCGKAAPTSCVSDSDQTTCAAGETCVWLNFEGRQAYYCATVCNTTADCTGGRTCRADAASSCMICHDLVGVCE